MQLGLVTYMWGSEWDLPTLIKNCEATGFEGVELRSGHKHGVEPAMTADERRDVAKRFADSPVELVGLGTACEYHSPDPAELKRQIDESKAFIRLCHDVGGTGIKVRPNGLPEGMPVERTLEQIGRSLNEVAAFGDGYGVAIRLEVHGHGTSLLPHIKRIMDIADHPGNVVCWNSNPTDLDGDGLTANFDLVKDRLGTIHIHDLVSDYPWRDLFGLLNAAGFNGWTLLEEGEPTTDPIRVMKYYRLVWQSMTLSPQASPAGNTPMGTPVVHFEIGCKDITGTQEFYRKLFGWKIEQAGPAATIDTGSREGIQGHITSLGHEPHQYVTVYAQVDNLQAYLDKAGQLGGKTLVPPVEVPGMGHFAWLADVESNMIGLWKQA